MLLYHSFHPVPFIPVEVLVCLHHIVLLSGSRSRTGLLYMSIKISKRSSNSPQSMPKRAETTEVSIGKVQTYIVLCGEGTLVPQWG